MEGRRNSSGNSFLLGGGEDLRHLIRVGHRIEEGSEFLVVERIEVTGVKALCQNYAYERENVRHKISFHVSHYYDELPTG